MVIYPNVRLNSLKHFFFETHGIEIILLVMSHINVNTLSANPTKWSNTLKQLVGCYRLTILLSWHFKGLITWSQRTAFR